MKIDASDDLGTAKAPFRVVAAMAVRGRLPLLKHTIERLYKKNGVFRVICAGDNHFDRKLVESVGAEWVQMPNRPLGKKWNASFQAAERHNPDSCLFVGSSDFLSDNWLEELEPESRKYDLIGTAGCNFLHIGKEFIACHWPGYHNSRKGESIGIGRLISRQVLTRLQWKPFSDHLDSSLDRSMNERVRQAAGSIQLIDNLKIKSCSISTDEWINKHKFNDCFNGVLPSEIIPNVEEWIDQNFPEAKLVFNAGVHQ